MERVVLRHLSGSKSQQVEEIPLDNAADLLIGRDPSATIRYDPERDDLVGRQHARLTRDPNDRYRFTITDLNSRNGTYVNRQRVVGTVALSPGDVVQLGPGGPEFQFDLEPPPPSLLRATRIADPGDGVAKLAATVDASSSSLEPARPAPPPARPMPPAPPPPSFTPPPAASARPGVGKATVERMVTEARRESRRGLFVTLGVVGVLAIAVGALLWSGGAGPSGPTPDASAPDAASLSPSVIAQANTESTVLIEMAWKLVYTPTGDQLFHEYYVETDSRGTPRKDRVPVPVYIRMPDGYVEPSLTVERGAFSQNQPIGSQGTGSGFVVTSDGFILTNRHVAAPWETSYHFPDGGGLLVIPETKRIERLESAPRDWVPTTARVLGRRAVTGKTVEGRLDYLDVTFAFNKLRIPAKLARVSDQHDVAMVKVDAPQPVRKVELYDNYDNMQPGVPVTVMGYPAVSPEIRVATRSLDNFNRETQVRTVPDPTVTPGSVGRVIRGDVHRAGSDAEYWSEWGDAYQLTVNATGPGNSGGPVFDDRGRVVGIYAAGRRDAAGTIVSFAVPIRFGIELMSIGPISR